MPHTNSVSVFSKQAHFPAPLVKIFAFFAVLSVRIAQIEQDFYPQQFPWKFYAALPEDEFVKISEIRVCPFPVIRVHP
jgi:hypothetical protein